jgi:type VI secretion system secreted protein VgrG
MLCRVVVSTARSSFRLARPLVNYAPLYPRKYSTDPSQPPRNPVTDHPIVSNVNTKDKPKEQTSQPTQGADFPNSPEHRPSHAPPPHDTPKPTNTTPPTHQTTPQQAPPTQQTTPNQQATTATPQPPQATAQQAPKATDAQQSGTPELTGPPPPSIHSIMFISALH